MKYLFVLLLFVTTRLDAQEYGCDKCSMLQEEYQAAVSPEKEKIYAFFKQECLQTDTVFVTDQGIVADQQKATAFQVVEKGKCIDFKDVKEYEKSTQKVTRSYQVVKKDTVYTVAGTPAAFPGGDEALVKYLISGLVYPPAVKSQNIEGTVYIQFVVTQSGKIKNPKAIRSPHPDLSKEALRVVKAMPDWKPARYKNQPVSLLYVLPVSFRTR